MKKLLVIAAFATAIAVSASFAQGIEFRFGYDQPSYDRQRAYDQQQVYNQQREQLQRQAFLKDKWQREQWQMEQQRRNHRHQRWQSYEVWLRLHRGDYDNRNNDNRNRYNQGDRRWAD